MQPLNRQTAKANQYPTKIIQFGEGNFLRAFVDWIVWNTNQKTDFNAGVVVVQPIDRGMVDMLNAQDGLYHVNLQGIDKGEAVDSIQMIDVINGGLNPYTQNAEFMALAEDPNIRFVISNTTEAGIAFDPSCKLEDKPASSYPGKLTQLLYHRYNHFNGDKSKGFIILPCELIFLNGKELKKCIYQYIDLWNLGEGFKKFVDEKNVFTNTLVDRINTGYPRGEDLGLGYEDNMVNTSEFFHLWVIETDYDLDRELPFSSADLNVIITPDKLEMYRTRKVRILNGAHTSLVPYALLSGLDTVKSCIDDPTMNAHLRKCVFEEIVPTLDLPKDELLAYANSVVERFGNPYIKHYLSDISLNSVSKF